MTSLSQSDALFETGATVLIARDVRDGLQIVWQRDRKLASAWMDICRRTQCADGYCPANYKSPYEQIYRLAMSRTQCLERGGTISFICMRKESHLRTMAA